MSGESWEACILFMYKGFFFLLINYYSLKKKCCIFSFFYFIFIIMKFIRCPKTCMLIETFILF
jgi:hypothetical protein